jgi:hypothetical protein
VASQDWFDYQSKKAAPKPQPTQQRMPKFDLTQPLDSRQIGFEVEETDVSDSMILRVFKKFTDRGARGA